MEGLCPLGKSLSSPCRRGLLTAQDARLKCVSVSGMCAVTDRAYKGTICVLGVKDLHGSNSDCWTAEKGCRFASVIAEAFILTQ